MSKDLFSKQSALYARYRPRYPAALFDYILQFVSCRERAWDCATGNGQAALELAEHFSLVHATDISEAQITNAVKHPAIRYAVSSAEETGFPPEIFDLITVAQAYHWLDFSAFQREARRVLKKNGIVAIWGYSLVQCSDQQLNKQIQHFYRNTVGPFWDPERRFVDNHYRDIPFPYDELPAREFIDMQHWTLEDLSGYLNTWSSVQHFIRAKGFNPVNDFMNELTRHYPVQQHYQFRVPLFLRLGTIRG